MRRILSLLFAVAVVVAYGFAARTLRDRVAEMAPALAQSLAGKLDVRIEHGDVTVSYLPLAAGVSDVRVSSRLAATRPFLSIDALSVRAKLLPLLLGRFEVREIVAERPRVELLTDPRDARRSSEVPDGFLSMLAEVPFVVRVRDGSVLSEDYGDDPPSKLYAESFDGAVSTHAAEGLEAKLEGTTLGDRSTVRLALRLKPRVGPTGGDQVALELDVDGASAAVLPAGFIMLRGAVLRDPLQISLRAEGLAGERSTETKPAEPLRGKLSGSVGVVIAGLEDRLEIDTDVALDDKRFQMRGGTGTWGGFRFVPTGWMTRLVPRKVAGRLDLEPVDLAQAAQRLGVPERWRPRGTADLKLRATGKSIEPLYSYEGTLTDASFSPWPALPIKVERAPVHGSLIAINADVSTSFDVENLQVGTARIDKMRFGLVYWKEKLSVTALDSPLYGGKLDGSVGFIPKTSADPVGGMLLSDADGKTVIENVLPGLPFAISGRLDTGLQLGVDEQGFWMRGRVGIHRGRMDGSNWVRDLVRASLTEAGDADAVEGVIAAQRSLLGTDFTRFERVAVDFETRGGSVTLPRVVVEMKGAELRGHGEIAADRSVSLTAALWPDAPFADSLVNASAALARARDGDDKPVLPCELRGADGRVDLMPSAELIAALKNGDEPPPLTPVRVGPADFGELTRLRKQFGR